MFTGFEDRDFEVFDIEGLDNRMSAIKLTVRPKLESLGEHFASFLSSVVGDRVYAHVAKHARRTVNPPDDTWVAFSTNARGYKQHPHFQIGLWQTHVFAAFGYIYEASGKSAFGERLRAQATEVRPHIPDDFCFIPDHTRPDVVPAGDVDIEQLQAYAERLQRVKKGELLIGKQWSRDAAIKCSAESFVNEVETVFSKLEFIYQLSNQPARRSAN